MSFLEWVGLIVVLWFACGAHAWVILWFRGDIVKREDFTFGIPVCVVAGPAALWLTVTNCWPRK